MVVSWPNGAPANGDILIGIAIGQFAATVTPPSNWLPLSVPTGSFASGLWWRLASGEPASTNWGIGATGNNLSVAVMRLTGAATTAPQPSEVAISASPTSTGAIVPAALNALVVAGMAVDGPTSIGTSAGCTVRASVVTVGFGVSLQTNNTLTSQTTTGVSTSMTFGGSGSGYLYELIVAPLATTLTIPLVGASARASNGGFAPTQISGCAMWVDAADQSTITQSAGLISLWKDKSGNANNLTATGTAQPTLTAAAQNGFPVVTCNGTTTVMATTTAANLPQGSAAFTLFYVFECSNNAAAYPSLMAWGSASTTETTMYLQQNGGMDGSVTPNSQVYTSIPIGTSAALMAMTYVGGVNFVAANFPCYKNGSVVTMGNTGTAALPVTTGNTFTLGNAISGTVFWPGWISEVVLYNGALTTAQRQNVEGYLAWKWGLQGLLPVGHPYQLMPPAAMAPQIAVKATGNSATSSRGTIVPIIAGGITLAGMTATATGGTPIATNIFPVSSKASTALWG